jgi:hypothetical protein
MQMFLGIKAVEAREMTRGDYNDYRGWTLPADEDGTDEGYLVSYPQLDEADNYESWCPKRQFDAANTLIEDATFEQGVAILRGYFNATPEAELEAIEPLKTQGGLGLAEALHAMKAGQRVCRAGWNGKGMYLFLNPGSKVQVSEGRPLASGVPVGTDVEMLPYIMMKVAGQDVKCIPWLASQADLLAEDWEVL